MKFKTIVLTRKKLIIIILASVFAALLIAAVKMIPQKNVDVFKYEQDNYEEILAKALPDNEEKSFNVKAILNKILSFDLNAPETIISKYSAVFDGTNYEENEAENDNAEEENVNEPDGQNDDTAQYEMAETPQMPDKEQISSSVGLELNNATDYKVDVNALCAEEIEIKADSDAPQVLVVHTHTTECYDGDEMNGETERNTDDLVNVVAVGNEICAVLKENGINSVHDTTYHDYPSYQGSYTRALSTIDTQLKNNPSIKVVLDVHRDAFIYPDGSKLKVSCEENGVSAAQVMIVAGTDSMGLWHDNWRENLKFAAKIQNAAEIMYPGLMRPINLRTERFNEHMTKGSLILEVGSNGNTLEEAKEGGRDVARAIAAVLKSE